MWQGISRRSDEIVKTFEEHHNLELKRQAIASWLVSAPSTSCTLLARKPNELLELHQSSGSLRILTAVWVVC